MNFNLVGSRDNKYQKYPPKRFDDDKRSTFSKTFGFVTDYGERK